MNHATPAAARTHCRHRSPIPRPMADHPAQATTGLPIATKMAMAHRSPHGVAVPASRQTYSDAIERARAGPSPGLITLREMPHRPGGSRPIRDADVTSAELGQCQRRIPCSARQSQSRHAICRSRISAARRALFTVFAVPPTGGQPPRERAKPRASTDRQQATPSDARRLSSLVKCPLSDTEPRPATPGT